MLQTTLSSLSQEQREAVASLILALPASQVDPAANWAERTYRSFEQENGEGGLPCENMANMLVHLERWYETSGQGFSFGLVLQRAKALKQMFDGADYLVKEGFRPCQAVFILHNHIASTCDCGLPGCQSLSDQREIDPTEDDHISAAGLTIHE